MYPIKTKKPYDPNNLAATTNLYTTVYLGNYINGDFRENVGSHCGVDMIPQVPNDSVFACLGGTVTVAGNNASEGNFVVIKHDGVPDIDNSSTTTLYSCYMHMSVLNVKVGDNVNEGDIIGKTGNTGNSTGEHLHFQIDRATAPFHPYWPFTFKDAQNAGLGFFEATNKGLGLDNGKKFTINPLLYLDTLLYKGIKTSSTQVASTVDVDLDSAIVSNQPAQTIQPGSNYFSDVSADDAAINYLAHAGISKGYGDGTFRPDSNVSRAEFLAMLYTFSKKPLNTSSVSFSDVSTNDWFYKYISSAEADDYVSGYEDGTFKPNNPVSRAEAIAITLNMVVGKTNIPNMTGSLFSDIPEGSWYERYVYYTTNNGLLEVSGNKFFPNTPITRRNVAELLYNLRGKV